MSSCSEYLGQFGISEFAVERLCKNNENDENDLLLLKSAVSCLHYPCDSFVKQFKTKIWSVIPDFCVPANLGWMPKSWPILIYPFAVSEEEKIIEFIKRLDAAIDCKVDFMLNNDITAQLYGGKKWFPTIAPLYSSMLSNFGNNARLITFSTKHQSSEGHTLAAIAKKLQLLLRPTLMKYTVPFQHDFSVRAFHTPNLYDISIHLNIIYQHIGGK